MPELKARGATRELTVKSRQGANPALSLALLPHLAAILVTTYVCLPMATGRYFGDVGDARWTVSLHEHWYRVWQGTEGIQNLLSYVPLTSTLGTSDAFFAQGQLYSLARSLGAGLPEAWAFTQTGFFLIGALGVATLARYLLKSEASQCAFVILACASYPVIYSIGHVQLIGFLSTSWIGVGWFELSRRRHVLRGWLIISLVPPILAMSSWYAVVLFFLVASFLVLFLLLFSTKNDIIHAGDNLISDIASILRRPPALIGLLLGLALWASVAWIYLPSKRLLPPPKWNDTVEFAPRISDILDATGQGGGIWGQVYAHFYGHAVIGFEQARGFTPVLFVSLMALGLVHLRRTVLIGSASDAQVRWPGSRQLTAVWLAVLTVVAFVIVDERGLGLYYFAFTYVPGVDSIRAPFRIQTLTYALAILVLVRSVEMFAERFRELSRSPVRRRKVAIICGASLIALIFVEMQRPIPANWTPQQFLDPALVEQIPKARQECDAIVVTGGPDLLLNVVDGVDFAALSGLPTPQGYGRADPLGHPGLGATPVQLAAWMRDQGFAGRICQVSPSGVEVVPTS